MLDGEEMKNEFEQFDKFRLKKEKKIVRDKSLALELKIIFYIEIICEIERFHD